MLIQTKRLIIRDFKEEDFDEFARLVSNKQVMEFSLYGPMSSEQAREYFNKRVLGHYVEHGHGFWALTDPKHGLLGFAGLIHQEMEREKFVELGYRLGPDFWGQGYATEAAKAICTYAFHELHLARLISIIDPKNERSVKVAKRIGMSFWKNAQFHHFLVDIYKIESSEWNH